MFNAVLKKATPPPPKKRQQQYGHLPSFEQPIKIR